MFQKSNQINQQLFLSMDYKIPYDHLNRSVNLLKPIQEVQYLKNLLQSTFQKLQLEIKRNQVLEKNSEMLALQLKKLVQFMQLQRKQNNKLRQVLQTILQNRKITQQQLFDVNRNRMRQLKLKEQEIKKINKEKANLKAQLNKKAQQQAQYKKLQTQLEFYPNKIVEEGETQPSILQEKFKKPFQFSLEKQQKNHKENSNINITQQGLIKQNSSQKVGKWDKKPIRPKIPIQQQANNLCQFQQKMNQSLKKNKNQFSYR